MATTSELVLRELLVPLWRGLAEVERQVGERVLFDEVLPQLDIHDPPDELRPAATVFQAIEDELEPGGIRAWPGHELSSERRRELAIIVFLDLMSRELSRVATRFRGRSVVGPALRSWESARVEALLVPAQAARAGRAYD